MRVQCMVLVVGCTIGCRALAFSNIVSSCMVIEMTIIHTKYKLPKCRCCFSNSV